MLLATSPCVSGCEPDTPIYHPSLSSTSAASSEDFSTRFGTGRADGKLVRDVVSFAGYSLEDQVRSSTSGGITCAKQRRTDLRRLLQSIGLAAGRCWRSPWTRLAAARYDLFCSLPSARLTLSLLDLNSEFGCPPPRRGALGEEAARRARVRLCTRALDRQFYRNGASATGRKADGGRGRPRLL